MFQNLRQGNVIYVLEKGTEPKLKIGEVVSVSNPTPKFPNSYVQPQVQMTVDVRVKVGEEELEFQQLQADLSIANNGNGLIVSDSREAMLTEVESTKRNSENVMASMEYHRKLADACEGMMRQLSPSFAKEKEQEEKIGRLEESIQEMKNMLSRFMGHSS